jgi:putative addiction module component (TIGR02574 family)
MSRTPAEILRDALELPPAARAALAGSLIDSLETDVDEDAEAQWDIEIARRIGEIDSGTVTLIPWDEARRRIVGQ